MSRLRLSFPSPVGPLTLEAEEGALVTLSFRGTRGAADDAPVLREARRELEAYFSGKLRRFTVPWRAEGTAFQKRVWKALERVPFGELKSYGEIAEAVGRPGGARAVGGAVGSNPLPVFIPCHRIIASGKRIGGFGPGTALKKKLLALEGVLTGLRD